MLLITALFTSYMLQQKKIQAVHETVISIFGGAALFADGTVQKLIDHRDGGRADYKGHAWTIDTRQCQLRLPVLLQSPSSSDHFGLWL
jgi:hypothetical protein